MIVTITTAKRQWQYQISIINYDSNAVNDNNNHNDSGDYHYYNDNSFNNDNNSILMFIMSVTMIK